MIVEQTKREELASALRTLIGKLAPTRKFRVKVVERAGASLRSKFSQGALWEGLQSGRGEDCVPCSQDSEINPPYTRASAVYENFCNFCNPEARGSKEIKTVVDPPSVYVGETSRSPQERMKEHQEDDRKQRERSHMWKHRALHNLLL